MTLESIKYLWSCFEDKQHGQHAAKVIGGHDNSWKTILNWRHTSLGGRGAAKPSLAAELATDFHFFIVVLPFYHNF